TSNESRNVNVGQDASQVDLNGTTIGGITSEPDYTAEYGVLGGNALEGLGVVPDGTGALLTDESVVTVATAADLALIQAVMNGNDLLTLEFRGATPTSTQYWGDGAGFGSAPILTLTFIPEPSSVMLIGLGLAGLIVSRVRRR
ncbi:MAG: PEP-CTERM sorting domain-containing protein, partial [Bythopirellula sp.]